MAAAGGFNSWSITPNLQLVSNNTWQGDLFVRGATSMPFKFVAEENWSLSWGESNQAVFTVPMTNVAEFAADPGKDMAISNAVAGTYRFTFHDADGTYSVCLLVTGPANYASMAVAGDFNGWGNAPNMTVVTNSVWQTDLYVPAATRQALAFFADQDWGLKWGETNQAAFFVPMTNTAEFGAPDFNDIVISNAGGGVYRFVLNDSDNIYSVLFVTSRVANYASMAVAGDFNGWNPLHNMALVSNYTWEGAFTFANSTGITFKFVANDAWAVKTWGASNQVNYAIPLMQTGHVIAGAGNNITLNGPLNGRHVFRFNDNTRYFEVVPDAMVETFDSWNPEVVYGIYSNAAGWLVYSGLLHATYSRFGLCARLRDAPTTGHYIQTPLLSNGIGQFSFWYRHWDGLAPAVTYEIRSSTNGSIWTTNDTLVVTSNVYKRYVRDYQTTTSLYIRLYHSAGGERVMFDDFVITPPDAYAAVEWVDLDPSCPWTADTVSVNAQLATSVLASNLVAAAGYRLGPAEPFTMIGMAASGWLDWFVTTSSIPACPAGTKVDYFVSVSFEGPGTLSPLYWPEGGPTNPASYRVRRNHPDWVWVNEVNYNTGYEWDGYNAYEFVELCGRARVDIGDWSIELMDTGGCYAVYRVPNNTMLPNDTNGFGFWVLGDSAVANVNAILTNAYSGDSSLAMRGAVLLRDEWGCLIRILAYGDPVPPEYGTLSYMGADPDSIPYDVSLGRTGTGTWPSAFSWTTNDVLSAGSVNVGQEVTGGDTNPLPSLSEVSIGSCELSGSRVTIAVTGTNGWNPTPFSSATVTNDPPGWSPIAPCDTAYSEGVSTLTFDLPTTGTSVFMKVQTSPTW